MSSPSDDFVDYFKIEWSRLSLWSLEQFAYLSVGKNPNGKKYDISPYAKNSISRRYYWLLNKVKKGQIHPMETEDGVDYFNMGSLLRSLKEKFKIEKDMQKCFDHMYKAPYGINHSRFVSRSVYREAGRLIFQDYPFATKGQVADILVGLPEYYNNDDYGHISTLHAHQIAAYLKGLNELNQKPAKDQKPDIKIDLSQLVEKMELLTEEKN